jgi:hypothetical protein
LPQLSDNHFNACLKEIARYLNFDRMVEIHEFDLKGRIKKGCSQKVPLNDMMSSKMMRKTFVSISISLGIPTEVIMKSTGHKTHAAFGRYVDISLETQAEYTKKWSSLIDMQVVG